MATLASLEGLLKKVVNAERLSASKMNSLTDMAMALMENDTDLVSMLYRTHKTLSPSSKVHSLYTFDALCRAARSKVNKLGLTGDINAEKGNCATFLLKIDGILDSLIRDMMSLGTTEAKEKTKKILDIWTKSNTFSPSVLARLADITKEVHKEPNATSITSSVTDPRTASSSIQALQPAPSVTPTADTTQAQALLQALLTGAVPSAALPVTTVSGSAGNQLGTSVPIEQVVLLQQLVEKAKSGNALVPLQVTSASNGAPIISSQNQHQPVQSIPSSASYNATAAATQHSPLDIKRDEPYTNRPGQRFLNRENRDQRFARDRENSEAHDRERPPHWRGGGFRGRGGGYTGRGGRSWRDYEDRDSPSKRHRSRSRSPPRFSGRGRGREIRPYSPPRRPSLATVQTDNTRETRSTPPGPLDGGKDEFGRDIRPSSPSPARNTSQTSQTEVHTSKTPSEDQRSIPQSPIPPAKNHTPSQQDLDKFDLTFFDFSSPTAWEALGNAWQVTHGSPPSQEQLMQFVMEKMAQGNPVASGHVTFENNNHGGRWNHQQQEPRPGKSIPTYESGSNLANNSWEGHGSSWEKEPVEYDYENGVFAIGTDTDAVVLGGGDQSTSPATRSEKNVPPSGSSSRGGGGGGMKRIGDKWVWQRS